MDNSDALVARSSFPDSINTPRSTKPRRKLRSLFSRQDESRKTWRPNALRPTVLIFTTLVCWTLIAVLQILLAKTQRDGGIIFAPKISALPLSKTFFYQYIPTIAAVVFSIFFAWIDLTTKRLEPFYQLSQESGALGRDSLLLHYPFDFLPLVPVTALKRRHWGVFWASTAVVLITWGIVPTQAGIFAVNSVTRTFPTNFNISTGFLPADEQAAGLSLRFSQSVYGIVTLNETLPPYMTRNYTLASFQPTALVNESNGMWTALTKMYSLDMNCTKAILSRASSPDAAFKMISNSTTGCSFPLGLTGNDTVGAGGDQYDYLANKEFSAMYVGYWNDIGNADYYLDGLCPKLENHTFYAAFTRNKAKESDQPVMPTALFCKPIYYVQDVNATVDAVSQNVKGIIPIGNKEELSDEIFNTTLFESELNSAASLEQVRGALPTLGMPLYTAPLANTNLSQTSSASGGMIHPMAALAALSSERSLQNYLDPNALAESYEAAYRLMFARAMVEVLGTNSSSSKRVSGERRETSQAVVLIPAFTFIVEGLLGLVSAATLALLYLSIVRKVELRSDPATIASIMSLTADDQPLLSDFESLDSRTMEDVQAMVGNKRYKLGGGDSQCRIFEVEESPDITVETPAPPLISERSIAKPIRPKEFRWFFAIPFIALHITLAIGLAVLYSKSQPNGLPLPSGSKTIQSLVENYLPTAIATLIEPMWILINRLLCLIQPLETLRRGNGAPAAASIDLDYSSLPPQLVVLKALRLKHFVLAAVCSMALLANVLAVAFASLFFQDTIRTFSSSSFEPALQAKFVEINGTIGPQNPDRSSGAFEGGDGDDQFLVAESNYTRHTPLPAWTDENLMYLPFTIPTAAENSPGAFYGARTKAFGASLECSPLKSKVNYTADLTVISDQYWINFNTTSEASSGKPIECFSRAVIKQGLMIGSNLGATERCEEGHIAAEFVLLVNARENATQEETETCARTIALGWTRNSTGSCGPAVNRTLEDSDTLFVQCQPKIEIGEATVLVDSNGRLQQPAREVNVSRDLSVSDMQRYFSNDPLNLVMQSNSYLFDTDLMWHNDSFASQFINHFIRARNGTRLLDPNTPPPTFEDVEEPLTHVYSYLFAIWLGINKEKLFEPLGTKVGASVGGQTIAPAERLFISTPMSAIAEAILFCYAIVAVAVYLRRPGQYLARLPTCIASVIALFAASVAVQDMRFTSHLRAKNRSKHLNQPGLRYGYGSFLGADGGVHIGIEKTPFVRTKTTSTWLEKKVSSFWKG